jgi:P4 family phage/plasmid primase-like protien
MSEDSIRGPIELMALMAKSQFQSPITIYFPACLDELWTAGCPNKETARKYARAVCLWLKGHWKTEGKDFLTARSMEIIDRLTAWDERNTDRLGENDISGLVSEVMHGNRDTISCDELKKDLILSFYCNEEKCYYNTARIKAEEDRGGVTAHDVCNVSIVNEGKDTEREDLTFSPSKAADVMINLFDLVSTPDGLIWVYGDGIYKPDGEHIIGSFLDRIVGDLMPTRLLKETIAKIVYRTREDYEVFNPDPCIFGVQNGVIDMRTGTFSPHSPSWRITRKAPVAYDPSAECPEIRQFLSSSLNPDDLRSLLEIFAAKTTGIVFEYFAAWVGRGQNGKTICEELIRAFWGDDATTEVQLSGLGKNRFDLVELMDKYWLINSEVGGGQQESRWIKLISGGGKVTADQKGRDHVEFRANCFIIFDCNNPPKFQDNSHGFNRRLILLTWPYSFVDSPTPGVQHERKRDPDLLSKITIPSELSGLLNLLIRVAPKVIESKMIYRRATGEQLAEEYDLKSSSAEVFWDRFCEPDDDTDTPSLWLYQKYEEFCKLVGTTPKRDRDFNDIGRKIHKVKKGRTDTPQGRVQAWKFISFSDEEYNQFLCSWSFRPASDQQGTSKNKQQDQQDQQDQHKDVYCLEEEKKDIFYRGSKTSRSCWSGGPDIDYAGRPAGQDGQNDHQNLMVQTLSRMEKNGDAYNIKTFELEWDLDEGEGAPILKARGWEERSRGIWYPPTRM